MAQKIEQLHYLCSLREKRVLKKIKAKKERRIIKALLKKGDWEKIGKIKYEGWAL